MLASMLNHSCQQCRHHKLRCSGSFPCSNCRSRGAIHLCHPVIRKVRRRRHTSSSGNTLITSANASSEGDDVPLSLVSYTAATTSSIGTIGVDAEVHCDDTLLRLAREALGDLSVCKDLIKNVFYWKVSSMTHGSIHLPTIQTLLENIFDTTSLVDNDDDITLCMMVTALGLQYMTEQWSPDNLISRIEAIGLNFSPRERQRLLWELSLKYTRYRMVNGEPTFAQIQTIMLLLIFDQDDDKTREQIFDHAVRSAQRLGMHHLDTQIEGSLSQEGMVRAWWFLVCHSWFSSLFLSTYSIIPSHFTTRLPIQVEEFDKQPQVSVLTNSSYHPIQCSFSMIELANMVRRLVDARLEARTDFVEVVESEFNRLSQQLPPQYSFDSMIELNHSGPHQVAGAGRPTVEKWMLHQQIFHAYLEFQRFDCHQPVTFSCRFLANHILDIQPQISTYCCVINNLRVNVTNVVKAAFVLLYDLMQSPSQTHMTRGLTIGKIRNALTRCKTTKASTCIDFEVVSNMLKMEDKRWSDIKARRQEGHPRKDLEEPLQDMTVQQDDPSMCTATSAYFAVPAWEEEGPTDMSMMPSDAGLYPLLGTGSSQDSNDWRQLFQSLFA